MSWRARRLWSVGIALASVSAVCSAAQGSVLYNPQGCRDRFVVETAMGYAILEWYGGYDPEQGDPIFGDFESYGFKDVSFGASRMGRVWVEDYWLSRAKVLEKMKKFCQ